MGQISVLGIDLAKNVFQLHGLDNTGRAVLQKKLRRSQLLSFMANSGPCLVGVEACGGAHYWAREFQKLGHEVRMMAPQFVKPYVKTNKNDSADAEAIAEALTRPSMRFVPIKQIEHQDIQCVHRIRQRLIKNRTALSNEIRGLLMEYGIVLAKNISILKQHLPLIIEDADNQLSMASRELFVSLLDELRDIEQRIKFYDVKIEHVFDNTEICQRISKIEGIGQITATAMVAAVSDVSVFKNGRQFSAWLGLVPRQDSSGGKTKLLGISKRGDRYIRTLLVHGARAAMRHMKNKIDRRSLWVRKKEETRGFNKACVALANKNARTVWALMSTGETYKRIA